MPSRVTRAPAIRLRRSNGHGTSRCRARPRLNPSRYREAEPLPEPHGNSRTRLTERSLDIAQAPDAVDTWPVPPDPRRSERGRLGSRLFLCLAALVFLQMSCTSEPERRDLPDVQIDIPEEASTDTASQSPRRPFPRMSRTSRVASPSWTPPATWSRRTRTVRTRSSSPRSRPVGARSSNRRGRPMVVASRGCVSR